MYIKTYNFDISPAFRALAAIASEKTTWERDLVRTLVEADADGIQLVTFTGTKLITFKIMGEVLHPGKASFNVKTASELLKATPKDALVEFQESPNGLEIRYPDGKARLFTPDFEKALNAINEWRKVMRKKGKNFATVTEAALRRSLSRSLLIKGSEGGTFDLKSMEVAFENNVLLFSDTDGHRATRGFEVAEGTGVGKLLIGKDTVQPLISALANDSNSVCEISATDNLVEIKTPRFTFITQLNHGHFPDFSKVLRDTSDETVRLPREAIKFALKAVEHDESIQCVNLRIDRSGASIEFGDCEDQKLGGLFELENGVRIIDGPTGVKKRFNFTINKEYFLDVLRIIRTPEVILQIEDENMPLMISDDSISFIHALMPMRKDSPRVENAKAA